MPEDDPRKGSKYVVLPPTANKMNVDTVVSILFQNCCVDCPIMYLSYKIEAKVFGAT
jgi:hypothetical protein